MMRAAAMRDSRGVKAAPRTNTPFRCHISIAVALFYLCHPNLLPTKFTCRVNRAHESESDFHHLVGNVYLGYAPRVPYHKRFEWRRRPGYVEQNATPQEVMF